MPATLTVDVSERSSLKLIARSTKDAKTQKRILIILALADGYSVLQVADLFLVDVDTVNKCRNKFKKRRLLTDWIATANVGYSGKLTPEQIQALDTHVNTSLITDSNHVVLWLKDTYRVDYTINGVTKLLHRLGYVYKQTTLVPGNLNEAAQAAWLKKYLKLKAKVSTTPDEVILFGDGVHPSHNVHATKAWIKRGEQKLIPTNTGRARLNINGALNVQDMTTVTHFAKTLDTQTTMELFDKIQAAYPDKRVIHLVVDNATYYKNALLRKYLRKRVCRIKLLFLPPYSPNLNFIERLWHFLKKYIIGTKRRQKFKEFEADIRYFFDHIKDYEPQLRQFIGTELHLLKAA